MKIVLNKCYGGFGLSKKAVDMLNAETSYDYNAYDRRTDEELIKVVEELGEEANSRFSKLMVVDIPDTATDWQIDDYDGIERITFVVDGRIYFA